jgi:hypothetical protein
MKCPRDNCDGELTVLYENLEYVEFFVEEINELGDVVSQGDIYDIEYGDSGSFYCTKEHYLTTNEVLDNDSN